MTTYPPLTLELLSLDRMQSFLNRSLQKTVEAADECRYWTGRTDKDGYAVVRPTCGGRIRYVRVGRLVVAVREGISYMAVDRACHYCDHPSCIAPGHIWHGDDSANQQDMISKGRQGRVARHGSNSKYVYGCRCLTCRRPNGRENRQPRVDKVRRLYVETGLGQRELAEFVGIPYQTVARWVRGLRPPQRDVRGCFS
jgi:Helix-turn-helix